MTAMETITRRAAAAAAHATDPEASSDPRIDALRCFDPALKFVGSGTIADILSAATALGYMPPQSTRTVEYGADFRASGAATVWEMSAAAGLEAITNPDDGGVIVSRTVTTFEPTTTEWVPVAGS
jgi:hypothetical protein